MKPRILITSHDEPLSLTRLLILNYNYHASHVHPDAVIASLQEIEHALLLVCHSVPEEDAARVIAEARRNFPSLPILRLAKANSPVPSTRATYKHFTITLKTEDWVEAVDQLLAVAEG